MLKTKSHYWNHRVITYIFHYDREKFPDELKCPDERLFSIVEVYYEDDKPTAYVDTKHLLHDLESYNALLKTYDWIKSAFKKTILDADHWPQEWKKDE